MQLCNVVNGFDQEQSEMCESTYDKAKAIPAHVNEKRAIRKTQNFRILLAFY